MNSTQFAENLLKALHKPFDPQNWMERLENVFYALKRGKQKPAEMNWAAMSQVEEESPRSPWNPINHCRKNIEIEKERLKEEAIEILYTQASDLSCGGVADGTAPFWEWPGPRGIFEECQTFAEWIVEEMKAPPVVGESDEGIGQMSQGCGGGEKITGIDLTAASVAFTGTNGLVGTLRYRLTAGKRTEKKPPVPYTKCRSENKQLAHVYEYEVVADILWDEYKDKARSGLNSKKKVLKKLKNACRVFTAS
jgi:hypothetical protein